MLLTIPNRYINKKNLVVIGLSNIGILTTKVIFFFEMMTEVDIKCQKSSQQRGGTGKSERQSHGEVKGIIARKIMIGDGEMLFVGGVGRVDSFHT